MVEVEVEAEVGVVVEGCRKGRERHMFGEAAAPSPPPLNTRLRSKPEKKVVKSSVGKGF